jgi:hypothetical protein
MVVPTDCSNVRFFLAMQGVYASRAIVTRNGNYFPKLAIYAVFTPRIISVSSLYYHDMFGPLGPLSGD